MSNERKTSPLGDLQVKEDYDESSKSFVNSTYEVRDKDGNPTGEYLQNYQIHVYIPDDVDEAGIGEPSIVLKRDQYINARALSKFEKERLPEFLYDPKTGACKVACKLSVSLNRKQYPKKKKEQ